MRWLAWGTLGGAAAALVVRFILAGDSSFTYDEATYVELARHPWWSSYYPDQVFLRHPPLAFLAMAAWNGVLGESEWVVRLPALLLSAAAVALLWDAARRRAGWAAAALVGAVLAPSFLLHAYALEATMYPYALAAGALAVWAHAQGRDRLTGGALAAFALTHLFGIVFLAWWAWPRRQEMWVRVVALVPAVWLLGATGLSFALNESGDIMRLGPGGQALRTRWSLLDTLHRPLVHLAAAAVAWTGSAWPLWPGLRGAPWRVLVALLLAFLLLGPPYPRYALLLLPFIVVAGAAWALGRPAKAARRTAAAIAVAVLSLPVGAWYLTSGPNAAAAVDVPGLEDWEAAIALVPADAGTVQASSPTAAAYYLEQRGWHVADRGAAPYRIVMDGPQQLVVWRVAASEDVASGYAIVPAHWEMDGCGRVHGLVLRCPTGPG